MTGSDSDRQYRLALYACLIRYGTMVKLGTELSAFIFGEFYDGIWTLSLPKLNRWLGYIQGTLIAQRLTTVEEERNWTRPLFKQLDSIMNIFKIRAEDNFIHESVRYILVKPNNEEVCIAYVSHDEHGYAGMEVMRDAITTLAFALDIKIEDVDVED